VLLEGPTSILAYHITWTTYGGLGCPATRGAGVKWGEGGDAEVIDNDEYFANAIKYVQEGQ